MPSMPSPYRKAAAAFAFASILVAGGVASLPSCTGLPDKTCFGDHVNALRTADDAGPDQECTTCLQRQCCDRVGQCAEDEACVTGFRSAQSCVVERGRSEEGNCKASLTTPASENLYKCTREKCQVCGLPSCTIDQAVLLIATPTCDRCMGGACCGELNACYQSRGCKLIIECITKHCPRTLGPQMQGLGEAPPQVIAQAQTEFCDRKTDSIAQPGPCLQRCLDDFAPPDGTRDDLEARCLAFKVYACGAQAKCGPKCDQSDAGPYSGEGAWPEDNPATHDASTSADAGTDAD
jgi:hypothetical protein